MKEYENRSFKFQNHVIKIMTVDINGGAMSKIEGVFQQLPSEVLKAIVTDGTEVAEACDMEEGCSSCGS
jgi:hypothetical protein|tara:strand:+ start:31 stop:237 length:207 start_codon:yes stop_codon:yes gene_type:complete